MSVVLATLMLAACQSQQVATPAPPPPRPSLDPQLRVNFVAAQIDKLAGIASSLPGGNESEFRSLMVGDLDETLQILPPLVAGAVDGDIDQQMSLLASCRDQIATMAVDADSDAVTTTAMLTATKILHGIAAREPTVDSELFTDVLDCDHVNERLDDYQGALHRAAVGRSARQIVAALRRAGMDYARMVPATTRP